jgi:hypothetical protein
VPIEEKKKKKKRGGGGDDLHCHIVDVVFQ